MGYLKADKEYIRSRLDYPYTLHDVYCLKDRESRSLHTPNQGTVYTLAVTYLLVSEEAVSDNMYAPAERS